MTAVTSLSTELQWSLVKKIWTVPVSCELASSINTRQKNSILKLNFSSNAWRVNWHTMCWFLNENRNLIVVLFVENIAIVFQDEGQQYGAKLRLKWSQKRIGSKKWNLQHSSLSNQLKSAIARLLSLKQLTPGDSHFGTFINQSHIAGFKSLSTDH